MKGVEIKEIKERKLVTYSIPLPEGEYRIEIEAVLYNALIVLNSIRMGNESCSASGN